ncbi:MAG: prefoldin subunit alpha [Candidatus Thorarchaeota archaeon]|nr:prefoldin subunit alpha [Candidatus Thorarchaeota archaeon]MCK5238886.1 prefoldin subunit alpha [Candidatus Thorarchaeota archaeon]
MAENPVQQLLNEQKLLEGKINELQNNIGMFQETLASYRTGLAVLEELETKEVGEKILFSVGGAVYIEAQILSNDRVIRALGSGVRVEQSLEESKTVLTERIEQLNSSLTALSQEYDGTMNRAQWLTNQMQNIYAQAQAAQLPQQPKPEE